MDNKKYIIGLDVSSKVIGCALFEDFGVNGNLCLLTAVTPKVKTTTKNKMEELFLKVEVFQKEFINKYIGMNITKVIIEEPLLRSNNVNTVATLLRFNGMISKAIYDSLGVIPEYISSYDARAYAFPDLMVVRKFAKNGQFYSERELRGKKPVLFGAYPYDVDKKEIVWKKVSNLEPKIGWNYDKKGRLAPDTFDQTDAYCATLGYMQKMGFWR